MRLEKGWGAIKVSSPAGPFLLASKGIVEYWRSPEDDRICIVQMSSNTRPKDLEYDPKNRQPRISLISIYATLPEMDKAFSAATTAPVV